MKYITRSPGVALAPFVDQLWYFEGPDLPHRREVLLPAGAMQLLVNLHEDELRHWEGDGFQQLHRVSGAALAGAYARPIAIDTRGQRAIAGASFRPGGAAPFFAMPTDELAGAHIALDDLWGRDGRWVREQMLEARGPAAKLDVLEAALLARGRGRLVRDPAVTLALAALETDVAALPAVLAEVSLSATHFGRRFARAVGLTPKRYARLRRFQRVLRARNEGQPTAWAQVAYACGYYDQAHLIHDFRAFAGFSPSGYAPRATGDTNHVVLAP